jgi:CheY-like chemotaxis protein/HPt (histidine-containing phosphotransfer) domain-containing protein
MVTREVMATVLTMSGYTVHTASSGTDAVAMLDGQACVPDVILMDTKMPGLNGTELIEQLRSRSGAVLYAMSGSQASDEIVKRVDGFLMKPLGPEALQKILEQHAPESGGEPGPEAPVMNRETLAQFRKLMPETSVRQIFEAVSTDLEKRRKTLRTAIESGDGAEVRRIGHAIKGGCGMAGATQAARIGQVLESRGDDLEYSESLLPHFDAAVDNLKRMLEAEFSPEGRDPAV